MKKVILVVAMVFATSGLVNAGNKPNKVEEVGSCFTWAFGTAKAITDAYMFSTIEDFDGIFRDLFSDCVDQELYD